MYHLPSRFVPAAALLPGAAAAAVLFPPSVVAFARPAPAAADTAPVANAAPGDNPALGCAYRVTPTFADPGFAAEEARYPDTGGRELTDGVLAAPGAPYTDPAWQGWAWQDRRVVTLDLGRPVAIRAVTLYFGLEPSLAIFLPESVAVSVSSDGRRWSAPTEMQPAASVGSSTGGGGGIRDCPVTVSLPPDAQRTPARYVQVRVDVSKWVFTEEIEVAGTPEQTRPAGPPPADEGELDGIVRERRGLLAASRAQGWMPPGTASSGGARQIVLMYVNGAKAAGEKDDGSMLRADHFLPYVAYVNRDGVPQDTLFDTFLFLPSGKTASGRSFGESGEPSNREDWQGLLDQFYQPDAQLAALDQAVGQAARALKRPGLRVRVVLAIPYPSPRLREWGTLPGGAAAAAVPADFSDPATGERDRLAALRWYVEMARQRWRDARFSRLDLIGFYWYAEAVSPEDRPLLRDFAAWRHAGAPGGAGKDAAACRLFWIPYYMAEGFRDWQELGFDAAMLQPNLSFSNVPAEKSGERMQTAARMAEQYGLGLEIELHWTLTDPAQRARYGAYLEWGRRLGYQKRALLSYYQSVDSLRQAAFSNAPAIRALYDETYRFVAGSVKTAAGSPSVKAPLPRSRPRPASSPALSPSPPSPLPPRERGVQLSRSTGLR